ncbi:D-glycerate dehydrogenase [Candidatus Chloroploca sp. Khr17]|uniref:2-hydroxyacid dehydrogenase n=1 Tax=Candidatus Chloroploca sp. Khr17 TaxID=2496869 RepID=UPI00101DE9F9|nr:D-glycerate dehydrogenase [Candidatus Chloroploca sp. Khr17]
MKKPVVFLTRRLPTAAMEMLAAACTITLWDDEVRPCPREALLEGVAEAEGVLTLLTDRVDDELLAAAPHLRIVANMAVGYDNLDLAACRRRGVQVSNTPGVVTETTADLAWALMLAAARRIVEGQKLIEAGGWGPWYPMQMVGVDIYGTRLGVVGAGRIGQAVLRRAQGFGMALGYHNRTPNSEVEAATGATYLALDELLSSSDVVVVTVPLSDETRGMFGAREFALMKPTAIFVNVARGPIVREAELVAALQAGRPQAVGIDVFEREPIGPDHPLLRLPNCVAVPHIGSATVATRTRMATLAAENVVAVLTGKPAPSLLNL